MKRDKNKRKYVIKKMVTFYLLGIEENSTRTVDTWNRDTKQT